MKKKNAAVVASLLAMSMILGACGGQQAQTTAESAPAGSTATVESVPAESEAAEESVPAESPADDSSVASTDEEYVIELDPEYNVPTDELLKLFPIKYETPAVTELNKKVQNRMLNGFNRWNMGYEAWEHWGEVLYHEDSIYNVNGVRLTLAEYQQAMDISLKKMDIQMGNFTNMILVDDWMAIQYDIVNIDRETGEGKPATTMEFARFGDYGELGAKVDEGWGGTRNESYAGTMNFQTEEERAAQEAFMQGIIDTVLPETDNLEAKYPVVYPTNIDTELGAQMKAAILKDFDSWNSGYDTWSAWTDEFYTEDVMYDHRGEVYDRTSMKEGLRSMVESEQRVRINNILVSEDWAAIHFYNVVTDAEGNKDVFNHMQFLHFVETEDGVKVDMCYSK